MIGPVFVDTNVPVYRYDDQEFAKQSRAGTTTCLWTKFSPRGGSVDETVQPDQADQWGRQIEAGQVQPTADVIARLRGRKQAR